MEERKPLNSSQGSLSCCQGTSPAPPPRMLMFFKVCAILSWFELSLLQEDTVFYRKVRVFYRKVPVSTGRCRLSTGRAACLQEALYFYRKLPVEVWDGPECISNERSDDYGLVWMHASLCWHPCTTLLPCSTILSTCNQVPAPAKKIDEFSRASHFQR
jgi:hypothetical protein